MLKGGVASSWTLQHMINMQKNPGHKHTVWAAGKAESQDDASFSLESEIIDCNSEESEVQIVTALSSCA